MTKILIIVLLVLATSVTAETLTISVTTEPGSKVQLTQCNEPWPYEFDCIMVNEKVQCIKKGENFSGFPACEGTVQTTIADSRDGRAVFPEQEPEHIYSIQAEGHEIRLIGHYAPQLGKPRKIAISSLTVKVCSDPVFGQPLQGAVWGGKQTILITSDGQTGIPVPAKAYFAKKCR